MAQDVLAIGVDGGASGVRALAVRRRADGLLEAAGEVARRDHERFEAEKLADQRLQIDAPRCDVREICAATDRRRAVLDVVAAASGPVRRIALGIAWPGQKSADGRGVVVMRNGPRDPRLLDELERELSAAGFEVSPPVDRLESDGVAGAVGERWADRGALRGVESALYFAGGSGLAEAVVVDGRVRALDELADPLPKAFELPYRFSKVLASELDDAERRVAHYEDVLAPGRWTAPGAMRVPIAPAPLPRHGVDWVATFRSDPEGGRRILDVAAGALVGYIEDRMRRLRPAGIVPERAVVGARLGVLLDAPEFRRHFAAPVEDGLERLGLPRDFVRASTLLEAPCYGAAAIALGLEDRACRS